MNRPAVLGGGSWGTALALVLARRGLPVRLWVHDAELAERITATRENLTYLPGFLLPPEIFVSANLEECVEAADATVFAVPSNALRQVAAQAHPHLRDSVLITATKGLEENSLCRMSQVLGEVFNHNRIVVLSGPSFAREVAAQMPTAIVSASLSPALAQQVQHLLSSSRFRVYVSDDVTGVELGGAYKNVIAIAAGVCHGLQLGHNAVAALITRGLAEMSRLGDALGAQAQTLAGLAGLGDLVLTCMGNLSRNRSVGVELAHGRQLAEIIASTKTVAEGVRTTHSVVELGRRKGVGLPIAERVLAVLQGAATPKHAIQELMDRSLRGE